MKKIQILVSLFLSIFFLVNANAQTPSAEEAAKKHEEIMKILMTPPKIPIKTIGIYVYDGLNTMDAFGPYHVLSQLMGVNIFFVAKEKGMVKNQRGLQVKVDKSIADVKQLDILVIPGGAKETFMQTQDTAVLNWIREIDKTSVYTTSVCTGGWILGATGLLKDKNVTTNWYRAEEIMKMYGAKFKQERYVQDGKYWTSAGVTAGMDMALGIMDELMGKKYTQGVMLDLEYDPKPPYKAGSVSNTEPIVVDMMQQMYDMGLQPLFEAEKKKRAEAAPKKPSIFDQWAALKTFHSVMSQTFHPAEEGKLEPIKTRSGEMLEKANALSKSAIPAEFNTPKINDAVKKLQLGSAALDKLVKNKKTTDAEITKSITALHDVFHEIVGLCRDENH
ncbi:MAG: DJ-1/PfpI family protein [Saprospiraceae bacterium]|nr:DJ-1/PfpI family protein [Saprospiraceae bacterium]